MTLIYIYKVPLMNGVCDNVDSMWHYGALGLLGGLMWLWSLGTAPKFPGLLRHSVEYLMPRKCLFWFPFGLLGFSVRCSQ